MDIWNIELRFFIWSGPWTIELSVDFHKVKSRLMACGDHRLVDPENVATGIHDPKVAKNEIWDHLTEWSWNVMKRPRVFLRKTYSKSTKKTPKEKTNT